MATFKEIRGQTIKKYTTNPTNPLEGQMWYNNTTGTLKVYLDSGGTWASAPTLGQARYQLAGAGSSNTSAVVFGGMKSATPGYANTEDYDGSSWTAGGALPSQVRGMANAGTQTAALSGAGFIGAPPPYVTTATNTYDGSTWTAGGVTNKARGFNGGCGTTTAALCIGGADDLPWMNTLANVEQYNGTAWTALPALPVIQANNRTAGTTSAAISIAGSSVPAGSAVPLSYDGSSWTAAPALNTLRQSGAISGIQTSALFFAGTYPPSGSPPDGKSDKTEFYDGTSWATDATLGTVVFNNASAISAPSSNTISAGGGAPATNISEVYNKPTLVTQTVTTS